ncbi:MAG: hypothetical protein MUF38_19370, partial [Anaerolineae bacterium]|nr:hypothetical protein [Anaerolineae bacterium]
GAIAVLWLNNTALSASIGPLEPVSGWAAWVVGSTTGDWGVGLLNVPQVEAFWRAIPYSIFVGVTLVGVALFHLLLTELLLAWAARRAQRIDA